ncbi:MAG: hypothetical protein L6Q46_00915 [Flavobacterium sp.]|uniref:hypothetical protein n=1 Tax=Flavobacterium sp. TaxID=239 RepID=UPI0025B84CE6|nr:hypothetical protein [Flavobacterium sp.]MCK6606845.1 hypothetical protein [Flavobacterium sp.]
MKILIFAVLFCFSSFLSFTQNKISYIMFSDVNSNVINHTILITISPNIEGKEATVTVEKNNTLEKYYISMSEFNLIGESILKIKPSDLLTDVRDCLDASRTKISFIGPNFLSTTMISYEIDCLLSLDENTQWRDFLSATNLILRVAKQKL